MAFKAVAAITQGFTDWYNDRNYDLYTRNLAEALTSRDRLTIDNYFEYFKSKNLPQDALRKFGGAFAITFFPPSIFSHTDAFKGSDYTLMLLVLETRTITPDEALSNYPPSFELAIGEEDFQALLACLEFEATDTTKWYDDSVYILPEYSAWSMAVKALANLNSERLRAKVNRAAIDLRHAKALRREINNITKSDSFQEIFALAWMSLEVFNTYTQYQMVAYEDAKTSNNPTRFAVGNFFAEIALKYGNYAYQLLKSLYSKYDTLTLTDTDKAIYTHALALLIQLAPLANEEAKTINDYEIQLALRMPSTEVAALKRNILYKSSKAHGGAGASSETSSFEVADTAIAKHYPKQYVPPMPMLTKIDLPPAITSASDSRASAGAVAVSFAAQAGAGIASTAPHSLITATRTPISTVNDNEDPNTDTDDSAASVHSDTSTHREPAMIFNSNPLSERRLRHRTAGTSSTLDPAS